MTAKDNESEIDLLHDGKKENSEEANGESQEEEDEEGEEAEDQESEQLEVNSEGGEDE